MDNECDVCDGEGYVPCEECNGLIEQNARHVETPLEIHKREVGYWVMVKGEIEQFNRNVKEVN